jgi:hypothetical protein
MVKLLMNDNKIELLLTAQLTRGSFFLQNQSSPH